MRGMVVALVCVSLATVGCMRWEPPGGAVAATGSVAGPAMSTVPDPGPGECKNYCWIDEKTGKQKCDPSRCNDAPTSYQQQGPGRPLWQILLASAVIIGGLLLLVEYAFPE